MKLRRWVALFAYLALLSSGVAAAQPADEASIRKILQERVDSKRSAGMVVGILDPGGRHVIAYGSSGSGRPLDADTVFEIGSITKVFTAALLADMVRRGEVRLEDPISKFLPPTVRVPSRDGKSITLLHLATQTSGLPRLPDNLTPRDPQNPYADYTVEKMYDFLSRCQLSRDPGEKYEYSNLGVGLLGHLLALRAGTSYEALLIKRILEPLRMRDTAITLSPSLRSRLAVGHDEGGTVAGNWDLPTLAGAGALRSTVSDMLKFLEANLGGGNATTVAVLEETHRVRHATGEPDLDIGLAWHIWHKFGADLVWHNGGTGGYHSWMGFLPKTRSGAVVLSNSSSSIDDIGQHLVEARFPLSEPPRQRKEVTLPPAALEAYVGQYQLSPDFAIVVTRDGNALFVQATGQPKFPIYAESETEFFLKVVDAQVTFVREGGKVTKLILHQNGRDTPGRKTR
jgi:D-alanyl-D-alanine-carboxypeptidase/D-alanyl-D-alanine-endopeptidase